MTLDTDNLDNAGTEAVGPVLTPVRAIRKKCLDCCCDSPKEVRLCRSNGCAIYPWRMGVRPNTLARRDHRKKSSCAGDFHSQTDAGGGS